MIRVTTTLLYSFSWRSKTPPAAAPPLNMRYFPTSPLEFASPFGNRFDFEIRSRRGVSAPLAQRTTALAFCKCSRRSASK